MITRPNRSAWTPPVELSGSAERQRVDATASVSVVDENGAAMPSATVVGWWRVEGDLVAVDSGTTARRV